MRTIHGDWTTVPSGKLRAAEATLLGLYGVNGARILHQLQSVPGGHSEFAESLARFAQNGCHVPTEDQATARKIMGCNMIGVEEAYRLFNLIPDEEELKFLERIPYTPELLSEKSSGHILVALPLWDVNRALRVVDVQAGSFSWMTGTDKLPPAEWHLIRITDSPPDWSTGGIYEPIHYRCMIYTMVARYLQYYDYLFDRGVWCVEQDQSSFLLPKSEPACRMKVVFRSQMKPVSAGANIALRVIPDRKIVR